jgi:hypothetical protein
VFPSEGFEGRNSADVLPCVLDQLCTRREVRRQTSSQGGESIPHVSDKNRLRKVERSSYNGNLDLSTERQIALGGFTLHSDR